MKKTTRINILIIFAALIIFLVTTIVLALSFDKQKKLMLEEANEFVLKMNTSATERIEVKFEAINQKSKDLAMVMELNTLTIEELNSLITNFINRSKSINGIRVAFDTNKYNKNEYFYTHIYKLNNQLIHLDYSKSKYNYTATDWFKYTKNTHVEYWSEPQKNEITSKFITTYSIPFFNKAGNFQGVVSSDIFLDDLQKYINSIHLLKNSYLFVLSKNGKIISHPDSNLLGKDLISISNQLNEPFLKQILNKSKDTSNFDFKTNILFGDKQDYLVHYSKLSNGWSLFTVLSYSEILKDIRLLRNKYLTIGGIVFSVLILIVFVIIFVVFSKTQKKLQEIVDQRTKDLQQKNNELQDAQIELINQNEELLVLNEKISSEEQHLQQILENIGEGVAIVDFDENFIYVNPSALKIFEVSKENLIGKSLKDYTKPEDLTKLDEQTSLRKNNRTSNYELNIVTADKTEKTIIVTSAPYYEQNNLLVGSLGIFRDITDIKNAQKKIEQQNIDLKHNEEMLEMTNRVLEQNQMELIDENFKLQVDAAFAEILKYSVNANFKLEEFLDKLLQILLNLPFLNLFGKKGGIFLVDNDENLYLVAESNLGIVKNHCSIVRKNQCLCGKSLELKKLIFQNHVTADHDITFEGMEDHGHYIVPFIFDNEVVGVLVLYVESGYVQKPEEITFLENVSNLTASIIQKESLKNKINFQSEILKQQVNELKKFQTIIEQSPVTIVITEQNGDIIYVNPYFTKLTGYTLNEVYGKKTKILKSGMTPDATYKDLWENINKGNVWHGEFINKKKDGSIFIEHATIAPVSIDGKISNFVAIKEDITESKRKDIEIKDKNRQLENTINNLEDIYIKVDLNGNLLAVSNSLFVKLGYDSLEQVAKSNVFGNYIETISNEIINKKRISRFTVNLKTKDNNNFYGLANLSLWFDNEDKPAGAEGIITDITTETELHNELVASNEKLFKNYRLTEKQKQIIEEKHKNLIDNINYALGIQQSLLPSEDVIKNYFKDYFLIYKPRDIVSGDFYYIKQINEKLIFAVGDCTGHGVTGAFMTILSISYLHQIVLDPEIQRVDEILEKLRRHIKNTFRDFGSENANSLDLALCMLNGDKLYFSGANLPLFLFRNNEIIELKPINNPIGYYFRELEFSQYEIKLEKNDVIYLFTDGYKDQFRKKSEAGMEKLGKKRFKNLLNEIINLEMKEQKLKLEHFLREWRKNEKQLDDITIWGIKI